MTLGGDTERLTVYLDPDLHQALRIKSLHNRRSMSYIVNEAVRLILQEDEMDLSAFSERVHEPVISYEELLADLKEHGKL
jgi:hypothetical protein